MNHLQEAQKLSEQATKIFAEMAIGNEKAIAKIRQVQAIQQGLKKLSYYVELINYLGSLESQN